MKKSIIIFCGVLIVALLCAFSVSAETVIGECGYYTEYELDTETGELTIWGDGDIEHGNGWIFYDDIITSVVIEKGVTGIADMVFSYLSSLTTVTIADSVAWIGEDAFSNCESLTKITIPDSVTEIGDYAFESCTGLENVVDGVVYIKTNANPYFLLNDIEDWSISSLNIPESTRFVTDYAVQLLPLTYVEEINVADGNMRYASFDGILFNKDKTQLICYPACKSGNEYIVPDSVTSLGTYAFEGCWELQNITLTDNIISIGDHAFYDSGILSITIPKNVTTLYGSTFSECNELTEILVAEDNMHFMDDDGILYSKDKSVIVCFPKNHSANAFSVPDGIVKIGDSAFAYCDKLTDVQIPQSVTAIGEYAFLRCIGLKSIELPTSVSTIGQSAFSRCTGITEFVIPNPVSIIESFTFWGCDSLTKITIPDSITEINTCAFMDCIKLDGVILPAGLTTLKSNAFKGCESLTEITIPGGVDTISGFAFGNCSSLKKVVICDGVSSINPMAFSDCSNLSSVTVPQSVASISIFAFNGCSDSLTIRCYKDSKAETFANRNGIGVIYLDDIVSTQGDVDGDGVIDVFDVLASIKAILNGIALNEADMDGDSKVTLIDIIRILKAITI